MDYTKLQNGSDIRGVAMEGIEGQHVNLTEQACRDIGRGFALWLRARLGKGVTFSERETRKFTFEVEQRL